VDRTGHGGRGGPSRQRRERERGRQDQSQGMERVAGQVGRGLEPHRQPLAAPPDGGEEAPRRLDAALGPALLLDLEGPHPRRELARHPHVVPVDAPPPGQLRPVAQLQVLGERRAAPPSHRLEAAPAPHARRAVEVEEEAGAVSRRVLDREVRVQEDRLRPRQPPLPTVQVAPGRLHEPHVGVGEGGEEAAQEVGGRDEVGVEDQEELAARPRRAGRERPRLVPLARAAPQVPHVDAPPAPRGDPPRRDLRRLVLRVVQDLHLEPVGRIVDPAGGVDGARHDVGLVVDRDLDGDVGRVAGRDASRRTGARPLRSAASGPQAQPQEPQAVEAERGQHGQEEQVDAPDRKSSQRHALHVTSHRDPRSNDRPPGGGRAVAPPPGRAMLWLSPALRRPDRPGPILRDSDPRNRCPASASSSWTTSPTS